MSGFGVNGFGGGDGFGAAAPYLSSVSPANLSDLERMQPITFTAADLNPGIGHVYVWMKYSGDTDRTLVYDGEAFSGVFERESTRVGNDFSVLPAGGWRKRVTQFRIRLIDSQGNIDVEI